MSGSDLIALVQKYHALKPEPAVSALLHDNKYIDPPIRGAPKNNNLIERYNKQLNG